MIEKFKDISKLTVIFVSVLYFFGFLTVSSYLARFGIISFDVINAQFIIAGIFSSCCIAIALLASWQIYKYIPARTFFNPSDWHKRVLALLSIYTSLNAISLAFSGFLNLGRYEAPLTEQSFHFKPLLGNYDWLGNIISNLHFGPLGYDFAFKWALYLFCYAFILIIIIFLIAIISKWFPKKEVIASSEVALVASSQEEVPKKDVAKKVINKFYYFATVSIETLVICTFIGLAIYSYYKLRFSFFDFDSLGDTQSLTPNLMFAWFYSFVSLMYVFLSLTIPKEGVTKSLFKFNNIDSYEMAFRQVIVPVLSATIIFGWVIYPRIPFTIGGGEPREINLTIKDEVIWDQSSKVFMLGESNQFIFVAVQTATSSEAFQINKDEVEYIKTR